MYLYLIQQNPITGDWLFRQDIGSASPADYDLMQQKAMAVSILDRDRPVRVVMVETDFNTISPLGSEWEYVLMDSRYGWLNGMADGSQ